MDFYRETFKNEVEIFIYEKIKYLKEKDEECEKIK
jgi:hypothetical protein